MQTYCFSCPACGQGVEVLRNVSNRNEPVLCTKCNVACERSWSSEHPPHGVVMKDDFVEDFGDGTRHYNRRQYLDKCKQTNTEPAGLLWKRTEVKQVVEPVQIGQRGTFDCE